MPEFTTSSWWQPEQPDIRVSGVLHFEPKRGWVLALSGTFENLTPGEPSVDQPVVSAVTAPEDYPILLGRTDEGRGMTAFGCQVIGGNLPLMSPGTLKLWPKILVHDVHFEGVEDFKLSSLSVRFSNLDTWVDISGFEIRPSPTFYPVEIRYAKPESLECQIEAGLTIGVVFAVSGPNLSAGSDLQIAQRTWLRVKTDEARPYGELERVVMRLSDLVSLAIGQSVRPLEFSGTCDARAGNGGALKRMSLKIVQNREPVAPELPDVDSSDMLFTASGIAGRFGELVKTWFESHREPGALYQLYFGTLRSPSMYVEQRFINMFQALESHDRRTRVHSAEQLARHQERLDRIFEKVTSKDKKWLKNHLRHSHEPTAADRIRTLVELVDAGWLLDGAAIKLAGDFRNFNTHFGPDVERRLPPKNDRSRLMYNLSIRLRVLCEMLLLSQLGFSNEWMKQRIHVTRWLRRRLAN